LIDRVIYIGRGEVLKEEARQQPKAEIYDEVLKFFLISLLLFFLISEKEN